ncbi:MAG: ribonuclease [Candidatus Parcubacteria bacterium]|jgi:ribonuclease HII
MKMIIGLDEVGRGALAGPVVVGCVAVPVARFSSLLSMAQTAGLFLRDSKKLTIHQRGAWYDFLRAQPFVLFRTAFVSAAIVDRINVSAAANRAALSAFRRVISCIDNGTSYDVYLDGGLFLGNTTKSRRFGKTIVRADVTVPVVSMASIVAKVVRDRRMDLYGRIFPEYGFSRHKGYGTASHYEALRHYKTSPLHRLTFLK